MSAAVLDRPTLVLNRNWQPVNVASVSRALVMLWNESARVVDPDDFRLYDWADWARLKPRDDEPFIQAVTFRMRVPELTIDHVLPRAQGGVSSWENCVLACVACNSRKANRTPEQAQMKLRKKPFRPEWKPMYAYSTMRIESWSRFISEAYWNVALDEGE